MIRKQLYIDADLDQDLKSISARTGRSEADHVRAALRLYLGRKSARPRSTDPDPLLDLVGLVDDREGPNDVAVNHDHYLYGAPRIA